MKIKFSLLSLIFLISFYGPAQINKDFKSNIKTANTVKLPLLVATGADKYQNKVLENVKKAKLPQTIHTIQAKLVPVPISTTKYSYLLDVTLTPKLLKTSLAGLFFSGRYHGGNIFFDQYNDPWANYLGFYFRAKRNKTYRATLKFDLTYHKNCNSPLKLTISTKSKTSSFNLKRDSNTVEFLIQSEVDEKISFYGFTHWTILCKGREFLDSNFKYDFTSLRIQELKD